MTNVLVESYRERELDVFIRSLNGNISKLSIIRGPNNFPEAYNICLKLHRCLPVKFAKNVNTTDTRTSQISN